MKHRKILFVCTGNTCRSPMAELLLKAELKKRKIKWFNVRSAGIAATDGTPMSRNSALVLAEEGIQPEEFRSRLLTEKMVKEADTVVCMTEKQRLALNEKGYHNVTSMYLVTGKEIPDPYGYGEDVYRQTLKALKDAMPLLMINLRIEE